jgi:transposase-like protein
MEAAWLQTRLESGRSIESIARESGKAASTVAYWVNKHGLMSHHAARHAPKGAIEEGELRTLVERGLSIRQIAAKLDRSPATIQHWLRTHGLKTQPSRYSLREGPKPGQIIRDCREHGWAEFVLTGAEGRYRCKRCNAEAVAARRRRIKEILVEEAGGGCLLCGFRDYIGALQFHHRDPAEKAFSLSRQGVTRSLSAARVEAAKCVLLCANCHAMVEAGLLSIPACADTVGSPSAGTFGPG